MNECLDDYEREVFGTSGGLIISRREISAVLAHLKPIAHEKILDVGTGTGRIARELVKKGVEITGVDISLIRIKTSAKNRESTQTGSSNYELINADGQFLPFEDSSFDAIVCLRTLKYFPDYQLGIREMSRVLKPGGRMVLSISNLYSIDFILARLRMLAYKKLFRLEELRRIFTINDLKIMKTQAMNKVHPRVWSLSNSPFLLALLNSVELTLQKATPKEFLPRELLIHIVKMKRQTGYSSG